MTSPNPVISDRSYGCTFGCGNPYDFVVVTVRDSSTEFLCVPCFVKVAADMVEAVTNPDNPHVQNALADVMDGDFPRLPGPTAKPRGRNAPVTEDDPDMIEAFAGVITEDELPDEFK